MNIDDEVININESPLCYLCSGENPASRFTTCSLSWPLCAKLHQILLELVQNVFAASNRKISKTRV